MLIIIVISYCKFKVVTRNGRKSFCVDGGVDYGVTVDLRGGVPSMPVTITDCGSWMSVDGNGRKVPVTRESQKWCPFSGRQGVK